jgi:hypothetical protein
MDPYAHPPATPRPPEHFVTSASVVPVLQMETVVLLAFVLQETVKMGQIPGQLQASVNVMGTVVWTLMYDLQQWTHMHTLLQLLDHQNTS